MKKRISLSILLISIVLLGGFTPSASSALRVPVVWNIIANYQMDEGPRQDKLHDSSRHHRNGVIGRKIETNGSYLHFDKVGRDHPLDPARTARVDSNALNPGAGNFSIEWRSRTTKKLLAANVVQKGQGSPAGGMFKVRNGMHQNDWLRYACFWRGPEGQAFTQTTPGKDYRDGKWHTFRCVKIDGVGVKMFADGKLVDTDDDPGTIANDWPLSIGGNHAVCEDVVGERRHCNYWAGDLAWMKFYR